MSNEELVSLIQAGDRDKLVELCYRRRVRYKVGERVGIIVVRQGSVKADCALEGIKPGPLGVLSGGDRKFGPQALKQVCGELCSPGWVVAIHSPHYSDKPGPTKSWCR